LGFPKADNQVGLLLNSMDSKEGKGRMTSCYLREVRFTKSVRVVFYFDGPIPRPFLLLTDEPDLIKYISNFLKFFFSGQNGSKREGRVGPRPSGTSSLKS
jgi:hypothetical protein